MNNLFLLLCLLSFVALIVGLIKPVLVIRWGSVEKRTRKSVLKYYGLSVILFFLLFGFTSPNNNTTTNKQKTTQDTTTPKKKVVELTLAEKALLKKSYNTFTDTEKSQFASIQSKYNKLSNSSKQEVKSDFDRLVNEKTVADKAIADAKAKADVEKAEAAKEAADEAARVQYDTGITYEQLARDPDQYKGKKAKFTGKVIQVSEDNRKVQLRIAVNDDYDTVLLVAYDSNITSSRILENDNVTVKGVSSGVITYQSTMGGNITIPAMAVEMINRN